MVSSGVKKFVSIREKKSFNLVDSRGSGITLQQDIRKVKPLKSGNGFKVWRKEGLGKQNLILSDGTVFCEKWFDAILKFKNNADTTWILVKDTDGFEPVSCCFEINRNGKLTTGREFIAPYLMFPLWKRIR